MRRPRLRSLLFILALISVMVSVTSAQSQSASLTGRVLDPAGAVVPGALVTVESVAGSRHTVTTNPAGVYSLPALEPGRYTLIVSLPAFRESRATVDIAARQQAVRDVSLEILPVEGSVTVEADAVDAIRATVADHYNRNKTVTSMEGKTVVDYSPVANYDALRLLPGVMSAGQKDRFSVPSHLRGAGAWGQVEQVDDYPSINITPVSAQQPDARDRRPRRQLRSGLRRHRPQRHQARQRARPAFHRARRRHGRRRRRAAGG
jgi:hypothetical protein